MGVPIPFWGVGNVACSTVRGGDSIQPLPNYFGHLLVAVAGCLGVSRSAVSGNVDR